jgi:hypothetical protein
MRSLRGLKSAERSAVLELRARRLCLEAKCLELLRMVGAEADPHYITLVDTVRIINASEDAIFSRAGSARLAA